MGVGDVEGWWGLGDGGLCSRYFAHAMVTHIKRYSGGICQGVQYIECARKFLQKKIANM